MNRENERKSQSVGQKAWTGCLKNPGDLILIALLNLVARVGALLCLFVFTVRGVDEGKKLGGIVLFCLIWALAIIPLRCWSGEKMRRMFFSHRHPQGDSSPYQKWLVTGLMRFARGLLRGIPFLACAGYFVIGYSALSVTDMWRPIQNLPTLLGMQPSLQTGLIMAGIVTALFALLFAYGWWRDMPVEYLPIRSQGAEKTLRWARRMRRHHPDTLRKNALINALWALPGIVGLGAAIVPYVLGKIDFSGAMSLTSSLKKLTQDGLPRNALIVLAAVFFLIYIPLCLYRKMRNAAVVARLMKGHASKEHHSEKTVTVEEVTVDEAAGEEGTEEMNGKEGSGGAAG